MIFSCTVLLPMLDLLKKCPQTLRNSFPDEYCWLLQSAEHHKFNLPYQWGEEIYFKICTNIATTIPKTL